MEAGTEATRVDVVDGGPERRVLLAREGAGRRPLDFLLPTLPLGGMIGAFGSDSCNQRERLCACEF